MNPELSQLLELQARDVELLEADTRLLEVVTQVAALDTELERAREGVRAAEKTLTDARQRRDELESKVDSHRKHQEKRKEKLGFLHSPKEVQSVMAEIDLAASVIAQEEEGWVRVAEQAKGLEAAVTAAKEAAAQVEESQAEQRAALAEQRGSGWSRSGTPPATAGRPSAGQVPKPLLRGTTGSYGQERERRGRR